MYGSGQTNPVLASHSPTGSWASFKRKLRGVGFQWPMLSGKSLSNRFLEVRNPNDNYPHFIRSSFCLGNDCCLVTFLRRDSNAAHEKRQLSDFRK